MQHSGDVRLPVQIENGEFDGLDEKSKALLIYAEKLTLRSSDMAEADLAPLREAGLGDEDILDVVMITSYYGYMNRITHALGVWLTPEQQKTQETLVASRTG